MHLILNMLREIGVKYSRRRVFIIFMASKISCLRRNFKDFKEIFRITNLVFATAYETKQIVYDFQAVEIKSDIRFEYS